MMLGMEIYVVTDKPATIGNVGYGPGSHVPLKAALDAGIVTAEEVAKAAGVAGGTIAPKKATAPRRQTRAQTPQHQTRSAKATAKPTKAAAAKKK